MAARYKVKTRFYVIIAGLLAVVALVVVLILTSGESGVLDMGAIRADIDAKAVLVRDETCVSVEKYQRVTFNAFEGQSAHAGDPIATVYKWGYYDKMFSAVLDSQKEIYGEQLIILGNVTNADLDMVNAQIEQKKAAIRDHLLSDSPDTDLLTLQLELEALIDQRCTYLRSTVQPSETLTMLYNSEQTKLDQLAEWTSDIIATKDGTVSFYFDGYEQAVNAEKLGSLNADLVRSVISGSSGTTASGSETLLYRSVNEENWYIAFVTPSTDPVRTVEGISYNVTFEGFIDKPYTGVALAPVIVEGDVLNILKFSEPIDKLISIRVSKAVVRTEATGIEAPLDAIVMKDGRPGLMMMTGGDAVWTEIDVLAANDGYAIVRGAGDNVISAGMTYERP